MSKGENYMKHLPTLAAILLFSACTQTEMVAAAKGECDLIGYPAGSPEYTACVERGYRGTKQMQDQIAADLTWWAILEAAY